MRNLNRITFAGVSAVLDVDNHVHERLRQLWPDSHWPFRDRRYSEGFHASTLRNNRERLLESPYPIEPCPGINEVIVPSGASRYSKALILVDYQGLLKIAAEIWGWEGGTGEPGDADELADQLATGVWGTKQNFANFDYVFDVVGGNLQMTALTPHYLFGGLWLVPLVDQRYFFQKNLRAIEFPESSDFTWGELFDALESISGMTFESVEDVPEAYLVPDKTFFSSQGLSIGHAIDAAALSVGQRVVYDGANNSLSFASPHSLQNLQSKFVSGITDSAPRQIQLGGYYLRAPKPKDLALIAPVLRNYYACDGSEVFDITLTDGSDSSERLSIYTTCYAQFLNEAITSESSTQLSTLASQLAENQSSWLKYYVTRASAPGSIAGITGLLDYLHYKSYDGKKYTRIDKMLPPDFCPRVQFSQAPGFFKHQDDAIICELIEPVPAMLGDRVMGKADARPLFPESGALVTRTKSDGSSILVPIYHAGPQDVAFEAGKIVQCKRIGCYPVVDVDYCDEGA